MACDGSFSKALPFWNEQPGESGVHASPKVHQFDGIEITKDPNTQLCLLDSDKSVSKTSKLQHQRINRKPSWDSLNSK